MPSLTPDVFIARRREIKSFQDQEALLGDAIEQENEYRRLFSTHRDSWEVPEVTDPRVGLVDVYANPDLFKALPKYAEDTRPRCFELGDKRLPEGTSTIVEEQKEFETSWDCFTESQLRFLDWSNVFAAGGSVGACLAPLPAVARTPNVAQSRKERRAYFHDKGYPGSDVDLFLYGLNQEQAEKKLVDIYQAVQAANPYEVICFRSAHAVTLVSQYPFRHIQVVLRLYNSPAEVLMGFDVDACACGYDGQRVLVCPRTVMAFATQGNIVDMSRRSPSYEMRLSKYAQRGFEVIVPTLNRSRVDPFIYEKRFDQVQGLARLLMLEKLRTPEARFQYKQEQMLKNSAKKKMPSWRFQREMRKVLGDRHNLERMETNILATADGAEISNYSTVFLAWGPAWTAAKVRKVMAKKDRILNSIEFGANGRVGRCTRKYRLHVCFFGTMEQVLEDCFPDDPPIPADVPPESLQQCVRGRVSWLVDNPGRQQIGSFHPITEGDWTEGTYLSDEVEKLILRCAADDADGIADLLKQGGAALLERRDFLGRSALHVAALGHCPGACKALLANPEVAANLLQSRLADGRMPIHLAAMHGFDDVVSLFCEKRRELAAAAAAKAGAAEDDDEEEGDEEEEAPKRPATATVEEILDIDAADWEVKLSPLQYAVVFGHKRVVEVLLKEGASIKKVAVHKDKNLSLSILSLCKDFACGSRDLPAARDLLRILFAAGASTTQVNLNSQTVWHELADSAKYADVLQLFLEEDAKKAQTIDILDSQKRTPLLIAVQSENHAAVRILLANGASPRLSEEEFAVKQKRAKQGDAMQFGFGGDFGLFSRPMRRLGGQGEDAYRMPVFAAVENGDLETLKVFLEHDATLVHATLSAPNQRTKSLLDMAEEALKACTRDNKESGKMVENCQKRVAQAKENLAKQAAGSYGERLWKYVLHQEEQILSTNNKAIEDTAEDEQEQVARAEAVVALIKERGGKPQPVPEGEDAGQQAFKQIYGFGRHMYGDQNSTSRDPLADYGSIESAWIQHMLSGLHVRVRRLPKGDQPKAHELLEAAWAGSVDGVRAARATLSVFVVNANGLTPMHACVLQGHAACAKALMEVAQEQFVKETPKAPVEGELPGGFASQIKRLNNLDLASGGGVPKDSGPTPDDMRRRLEALEVGISAIEKEGEKDQGPVKSPLVPLAFLLPSCAFKVSDLPPLKALFDRAAALRGAAEDADEEEGEKAGKDDVLVSLHPLELAVIRGDLQTLETLLAYIPSSKPAAEDAKKEEEEGEAHEEAEHDEEEEDEEEEQEAPQSGPQVWRQWRHMLLEHKNQALWNLDLLSLAAVMDNTQIFLAVAAKVEEHGLPLGALRLWHLEIKKSEENPFAGKEVSHRSGAMMNFAMDYVGSEQHPTLLQRALWWGAANVVELLLSGGADSALLGWLTSEATLLASKPAETGRLSGKFARNQQLKDSARRWLVTYLAGKPEAKQELVSRFVGPTAVDSQGRSAIFYASPKDLPKLLALGPDKGGNLEQKMRGGLTPALSAAGWGDEERLVALLEAKASATVLAGKLNLNILHLALNCSRPKNEMASLFAGTLGFPGQPQAIKDPKWERPVRIIQAVLQRVSPEVAQQLLLAPEAEHTPLMLALEKKADPAVLELLSGKSAEVLARRDFRMSNVLHLVAAEAPPEVNAVKLLVDLNQAQGTAGPLSPDAENARGNTPLELVMNTVVQVWEPNVRTAAKQLEVMGRGTRTKPRKTKRNMPSKDTEEAHPTDAHVVYKTLEGASRRATPGHRIMVGFDVVKEAANRSTAEAQQATSPSPAADVDDVTFGSHLLNVPLDFTTQSNRKMSMWGYENRFPQIQEG